MNKEFLNLRYELVRTQITLDGYARPCLDEAGENRYYQIDRVMPHDLEMVATLIDDLEQNKRLSKSEE